MDVGAGDWRFEGVVEGNEKGVDWGRTVDRDANVGGTSGSYCSFEG